MNTSSSAPQAHDNTDALQQRLARELGPLVQMRAADYWARTRNGRPAALTRPAWEGKGRQGDRAAHGSGNVPVLGKIRGHVDQRLTQGVVRDHCAPPDAVYRRLGRAHSRSDRGFGLAGGQDGEDGFGRGHAISMPFRISLSMRFRILPDER